MDPAVQKSWRPWQRELPSRRCTAACQCARCYSEMWIYFSGLTGFWLVFLFLSFSPPSLKRICVKSNKRKNRPTPSLVLSVVILAGDLWSSRHAHFRICGINLRTRAVFLRGEGERESGLDLCLFHQVSRESQAFVFWPVVSLLRLHFTTLKTSSVCPAPLFWFLLHSFPLALALTSSFLLQKQSW